MHLATDIITSIALVVGFYVLYGAFLLVRAMYRNIFPHLGHIPGPKSSSLFFGNFKEIGEDSTSTIQEQWAEQYGPTFHMRGMLNTSTLCTQDTKAVSHILKHSEDIYYKPEAARFVISRMLGNGLLVAEGEPHRKLRRVMNPAFGPAQVRALTEIFVDKSLELRDYWMGEVGNSGKEVVVGAGLGKMTLDVIGQAGFNYEFDSLSGGDNSELSRAFSAIFGSGRRNNLWDLLITQVPPLRKIPVPTPAVVKNALRIMNKVGTQLVQDTKKTHESPEEKEGLKRSRDLLSLMMKYNLSAEVPENQRMTDEDVIAQIPTFLVAGHETTSTSTSWAIWILTQRKDIQAKLRQELLNVGTDNPSMEELNALPYLDSFVREVLRVHAPIVSVNRVAMKDDVLPLKEPVTDLNGKVHTELHVKKGQIVQVSIIGVNKDKSLWGEDAKEFKPERWEKVPESTQEIPGVWSHMMTFNGGMRACIGWRFSVVEMKALIFTLVRAFEFDLAVPKEDIAFRRLIPGPLVRPSAKSRPGQFPVMLTPSKRAD